MKMCLPFKLGSLLATVLFCTNVMAAPMVVNGDFESDTDAFTAWPGYVGDNPEGHTNPPISNWAGNGGHGINPVINNVVQPGAPSPFRDNGNNDTHVAFLQGASSIEQEISGFVVGQEYTLGLDFNSRNCCGDVPIADVLLDGNVISSSTDLPFPGGGVIPVGADEPWYHADIPFDATSATMTLRIESRAMNGGDATLLVDNVTIVPEPTAGLMAIFAAISLAVYRRRR